MNSSMLVNDRQQRVYHPLPAIDPTRPVPFARALRLGGDARDGMIAVPRTDTLRGIPIVKTMPVQAVRSGTDLLSLNLLHE